MLQTEKRILEEDLKAIQKLECFGRMIANTDRHAGNLSFFWDPGDSQARLALVCDMLPMLYAASSGGEDTRKVFVFPAYDHTLLLAWKAAQQIAMEYLETVRSDLRVSSQFKKIADQSLCVLKR